MSKLNIGILVLASFFILASSPGIGSFSLFQVRGEGITGSYQIEISSYNSALKTYTQKYTTSINGKTKVEYNVLPEDKVNSKEEDAALVDSCETKEVSGKLEVVKVPAGTFETCKMSSADGQVIYTAPVPFGFVKLITPKGHVFELEDYEYRN